MCTQSSLCVYWKQILRVIQNTRVFQKALLPIHAKKTCVHIPLHTAATIIRGGLSAAYLSCVFTLTCGTFNIGN